MPIIKKGWNQEMKIIDFETNKRLNDVALYLSPEEAATLRDFLNRLIERPAIQKVYLSEIVRNHLERELTVALEAA